MNAVIQIFVNLESDVIIHTGVIGAHHYVQVAWNMYHTWADVWVSIAEYTYKIISTRGYKVIAVMNNISAVLRAIIICLTDMQMSNTSI